MNRFDRLRRPIGWTLAALGAAAILAITVTPAGGDDLEPMFWCLTCGQFGSRAGVDLVLNILLYVPLGLGLGLVGLSWRTVLAVAAIMTVTIESLQLRIIPGRFGSVSDIGANIIGAAVGMLLVSHWRTWLVPNAPGASRLAVIGTALWAAIVVLTAWALRPALPPATYRIEWAAPSTVDPDFPGSIVAAAVNGASLSESPVQWPRPDHAQLRQTPLHLDLTMISWGETGGTVPLVAIVRGEGRQVVLLAQDERELVFRQRLRARNLRFRHPAIELRDVFPSDDPAVGDPTPSRPDTIAIAATVLEHGLQITVESGGQRLNRYLAYSPFMSWGLVADDDSPLVPWFRWATAGWIAVALLPIGYWVARARRRVLVVWVIGVVVATFIAVPLWFGFPVAHWSEWLAGGAALAAGWGAATMLARREAAHRPEESAHVPARGRTERHLVAR